jgi:selenocysteine lyase/cysteine desulfurase
VIEALIVAHLLFVLQVRDLVLKFFNADPAEYQVVFTRSATGALKLVGETFPWSRWVSGGRADACELVSTG